VTRRIARCVATAAVVCVALGAGACGLPTANTPTAIARSAVPYHLLNPPTTTTTAPGTPPAVGVAEQIYLVSPDGQLVAVDREVAVPASSSQVLGALLAGPTATESASGIQSFLTGNGVRASVTESGGIATVDFSTSPIQVVGPDQTLAIAQVVYTVTQQPGITGVSFEIGGKPIEVPTATATAQVPGPVGRADYLPQGPVA